LGVLPQAPNIAQDQFNNKLLKVIHLKSKYESAIINNLEGVDTSA
jgi:hypothetical protein